VPDSGTQDGTPDDKGKPEKKDKPEAKGKPEKKGKPEDKGKPGDKGKPEETGKPEDAGGGKPDDTGNGKPDEVGRIEPPVEAPAPPPAEPANPTDSSPTDSGTPPEAPPGPPEIPPGQANGNGNGNGNSAGVIKFDESTFQVLEGGVARIVVERSHGETGAVSVHYATADGSAHAGEDYTAASGTLTWAAGDERNKVIEVPTLDDSAQEGNETVRLTLSAPTGGAAIDTVRGTATLNIVDDDGTTTACADDDDTLCLLDDRFKVEVVWRTPQGQIGVGHKVQLTRKSGTFWFFDAQNVEMLIKVLDACQVFGNHWVFFAATTNVDFTVTVTDTRTGVVKQYTNPAGKAASPVQDTFTFPCSR
jgi:hypothetical protein